ncbi:PREDICTED: uncharacterized protein LOC108373540 [Rhagoletis zephyria]|uniref:uncharacterized protein LOC108373540 n=1 Tax=Rhagoletis zephyria TaxID=28612 RepID=UPI0008115D24|nr:PREDICTED: uncharacterized protein LOC108373540 [Rhagoletis zephyria]XP_017484931.1 PREDICTED: uncharacterized protein LOC108373540 [Rhagoletis zephyria]XP_017484932.1 PREDICTED: uncharacterized protein LOC108373540 [Rhagoletis zephyria]
MKEIESTCSENSEHYITVIKTLIAPEGLAKNIARLIDRKVILMMNYDGVNNKISFKEYKCFNNAIFEALKKDGYTEKEYVRDIRTAFKNCKNVFYKNACIERKKKSLQRIE